MTEPTEGGSFSLQDEIRMPVNVDFTAYACIHAEEILRNAIGEEIKAGHNLTINGFKLKVPSQTFSMAVGVAHYFGYVAEVDFSLMEDGWKLECSYHNDKFRFATKTIYSPGA